MGMQPPEPQDFSPDINYRETSIASSKKIIHLTSRRLITATTIVIILALVAAATPWWTNAAQGLWRRIFPPPPYTGSLVFDVSLATLTARATTDGRVIWRIPSIPQSGAFLRDGATLYIIPQGQQRLLAIRVSDGHQLWAHPVPLADYVYFVGSYHHTLYIRTYMTTLGTGTLLSVDEETGSPKSEAADIASATIDMSVHLMAYCQRLDTEHTSTIVNLDSQQTLWQHKLPGIICESVLKDTLFIDISHSPISKSSKLVAFDLLTGATLWQTNSINGIFPYSSTTTLIVESSSLGKDDTFTAFDTTNGAQLWSFTSTGANTTTLFYAESWHKDPGNIFLSDAQLVSIDECTGTTLWTLPTQAIAANLQSWQADMDATTLYFADRSQLLALDFKTGAVRWHTTDTHYVPTSLYLHGQVLYETVGAQLLARNASTGKVLWQQPVSASATLCVDCDTASSS
jgi:outer membrane protein assembly factor BamB